MLSIRKGGRGGMEYMNSGWTPHTSPHPILDPTSHGRSQDEMWAHLLMTTQVFGWGFQHEWERLTTLCRISPLFGYSEITKIPFLFLPCSHVPRGN